MADVTVRVVDCYVYLKMDDDLKFLLLKRNKNKIYEHLWQGVAGKIEEGETAPEAAIRELKEETGLDLVNMFAADHVSRFYEVHGDRVNLVPVFGMEVDSDEVMLSEEHVDFQCKIQNWVDSSISKTVNAPKGYTVKQVQAVYERLYNNGAKGGTVYVDGSRDQQVLNISKEKTKKEIKKELKQKPVIINERTSANIERLKDRMADVPGLKTNRSIGMQIGDECPVCHLGTIEDLGGCNTCTNCGIQLKCGL